MPIFDLDAFIPPITCKYDFQVSSSTDLRGQMIIAGLPVNGSGADIRGFDPNTGSELEPATTR